MTLEKTVVGSAIVALTLLAATTLPRFLDFKGGDPMADLLTARTRGSTLDQRVTRFNQYYHSERQVVTFLLEGSVTLADAVEALIEEHEEMSTVCRVPLLRNLDPRVHMAFGLVGLCRARVEDASKALAEPHPTLSGLDLDLKQYAINRGATESLRILQENRVIEIDSPLPE
jgi:hypothetical protein